jgi:hypothetical protein
MVGLLPIVVNIVFVTDVEGRVSKRQIHPPFFQLMHPLDAVRRMNGTIREHLWAFKRSGGRSGQATLAFIGK